MIYRCKFKESPSPGSENILLTRLSTLKCVQGHQNLISCDICASSKKIHPLVQMIFYLQDYDLEYEVKVTKIKVTKLPQACNTDILMKFEEIPSTGSKDILLPRLWSLKRGSRSPISNKFLSLSQ